VQPYDPASFKHLTFHDAVPAFLDGRDSPTDYLERCLAIIEEKEPWVQAWQAMRVDAARGEAQASTLRYKAGKPLSPIDGMPIGIKDLIQTRDLPTGEGIHGNRAAPSGVDSASAQALRAAGAVLLGKLVTTELGGGEPSRTRNPFDVTRSPGGSSSGSAAAIGAGMLPAAIGTQVGGSIIRPAGYCANFAAKPTFGALNRGERLNSSQACLGVHAGSLRDMWSVMHEIARRVGGDPGHPGLFGPATPPDGTRPNRLIVMECSGWKVTDDRTQRAFEDIVEQLRSLGVSVARRGDHPYIDAFEQSLEKAGEFTGIILGYESRWYNENLVRGHAALTASTMSSLEKARTFTLDDYRHALAQRHAAQQCFARLAPIADALISPTSPGPAPALDAPRPRTDAPIYVATGNPVFNLPTSLLLAPVVALPLLRVGGMPVGVQVMGQPHDDYRVAGHAQWMTDNLLPASVA
jgi:Asp-tRNA(Asn)/Glu-tRNA(Gln) amidotransferase A subunit family amidase